MKVGKLFANTVFDTLPIYKLKVGTEVHFWDKENYKHLNPWRNILVKIDASKDEVIFECFNEKKDKIIKQAWPAKSSVSILKNGKKQRNKR